jgi:hypothetical protein
MIDAISCSGHAFTSGLGLGVGRPSQQAAFVGPGGAYFVEVAGDTNSPGTIYKTLTRPLAVCSSVQNAHIEGIPVRIHRLDRAQLSLFRVTADTAGYKVIEDLAFVQLDHSVLCIFVAFTPKFSSFAGLIAQAVHLADPAIPSEK